MFERLCASFAVCHIDVSRRLKYLPVWVLLQSFTVYDQRLAAFLFSILPGLGRYIVHIKVPRFFDAYLQVSLLPIQEKLSFASLLLSCSSLLKFIAVILF